MTPLGVTNTNGVNVSKDKFIALNAELNFFDKEGKLQLHKDKESVREYFLSEINQNTVFFHDLEEKLKHLLEHNYYEREWVESYDPEFLKQMYKFAYQFKFRFTGFMGARIFFTNYALRTDDGKRYLERFEDRVVATALYLAQGREEVAKNLVTEMMEQVYQPATPTFSNAGRARRGELVSCFLLLVGDDLNSISRSINASLQLSKRGGGVALGLTDIREAGAPIKGMANRAKGPVPIMKLYEDSFSYADQLGTRPGAGAVYVSVHHPNVMDMLDTKRENADEKIRIKTLSIGIVVSDVFWKKWSEGKPYYTFSPYDVKREYGKEMSSINITEMYEELVENENIRKWKLDAEEVLQAAALISGESGYPYVLNGDVASKADALNANINMSNLCVHGDTKILTDKGHIKIGENVGKKVNVWNGQEWSNVELKQTGTDQKMLEVSFNHNQPLVCTPQHQFYIQEGYGRQAKILKVEAKDLKKGDKLIRFETEVIEGDKVLEKAYTNGFYTADGSEVWQERYTKPSSRIYLYGEKMKLKEHIEFDGVWLDSEPNRLTASNVPGLQPSGFVPDSTYTVESRVKWLAGLLDGDGTVAATNLQIGSVDFDFLYETQLMLQTLGVDSRVSKMRDGAYRPMPTNDGTGDKKDYWCKANYRLLIGSKGIGQLIELGLNTKRIVLPDVSGTNRSATHMIKVESVKLFEGKHNSYCFTEPKRNMGVFNGLLTGQCSEIIQSNQHSTYNEDLSYDHLGMDISCNLGSLNLVNYLEAGRHEQSVDTAMRALSAVSYMSDIQAVPSIANANAKLRAVGLGAMNLAGLFGKYEIMYGDEDSIELSNLLFMAINYYSIKSSLQQAIEFTPFDGWEQSKYGTGEYFFPYTEQEWVATRPKVKEVFNLNNFQLPSREDWQVLAEKVMEHGLYNAYRMAIPPTGSISYINNATSSVHPIAAQIELREQGQVGLVCYPAPHMTNDNRNYFPTAYDVGTEKLIDVYAAITPHVDQGMSLTVFHKDGATTQDVIRAWAYARAKGCKTVYYARFQQRMLDGTEEANCVSCEL